MASYLHRTATTAYPCYLPVLGDLTGAGRIRLAITKLKSFSLPQHFLHLFTTNFFKQLVSIDVKN